MPMCVICEYQTHVASLISFHLFPSDVGLKRKWLEAFGMSESGVMDLVCSLHFTPDCFEIDETGKLKVLKPRSVPTKYLDGDKEKVKKVIEQYNLEKKRIQKSILTKTRKARENAIKRKNTVTPSSNGKKEDGELDPKVLKDRLSKLSSDQRIQYVMDLVRKQCLDNKRKLAAFRRWNCKAKRAIANTKAQLRKLNQEVSDSDDEEQGTSSKNPIQNQINSDIVMEIQQDTDMAKNASKEPSSQENVIADEEDGGKSPAALDLTEDSNDVEFVVETDAEPTNNDGASLDLDPNNNPGDAEQEITTIEVPEGMDLNRISEIINATVNFSSSPTTHPQEVVVESENGVAQAVYQLVEHEGSYVLRIKEADAE